MNSVILPGARIGATAHVHDSIVAGQIGSGARLTRVVIGADAEIPAGAELSDVRVPSPD